MKLNGLSLLLLAALAGAAPRRPARQPGAPARPVAHQTFELPGPGWTIGEVHEGAVMEKRVRFTYWGTAPSTVSVYGSCECVGAVPAQILMTPGKSAEILLRYDTRLRGPQMSEAVLFSALGDQARFRYPIQGTIIRRTFPAPPSQAAVLEPREAYRLLRGTSPPLAVDVREGVEFRDGHLPDAVNVPSWALVKSLNTEEGSPETSPLRQADRRRPLLVYGAGAEPGTAATTEASSRVGSALSALWDGGFRSLAWIPGGYAAWKAAGLPAQASSGPVTEAGRSTPEEVYRLIMASAPVVVLDVRHPPQFLDGHLPGARSLPLEQVGGSARDLPSDKEIIVYCGGGGCPASHLASRILIAAGISPSRVKVLEGGFQEWRRLGYPVVR